MQALQSRFHNKFRFGARHRKTSCLSKILSDYQHNLHQIRSQTPDILKAEPKQTRASDLHERLLLLLHTSFQFKSREWWPGICFVT